MGSLPAPGTPAPDFTLPSTGGVDLTLSELRGKNVLLPAGIVQWAFAEDTPGTRRENEELLAHLEAHRRSA
jgi:peroxiredoxin Q/BCP